MKKLSATSLITSLFLAFATPAFAQTTQAIQSPEVTKIVNLITQANLIFTLVAGALAGLSLILAGITYITSSGNIENTERAKNQAKYTIIGLVLVFLASLIVTIVTQVVTSVVGT